MEEFCETCPDRGTRECALKGMRRARTRVMVAKTLDTMLRTVGTGGGAPGDMSELGVLVNARRNLAEESRAVDDCIATHQANAYVEMLDENFNTQSE